MKTNYRRDRPIKDLLASLADGAGEIARDEFELAKLEISSEVDARLTGTATKLRSSLIAGGFVLAGLIVGLEAAAIALRPYFTAPWAAHLCVAGISLALGAAVVIHAKLSIRAEKKSLAIQDLEIPHSLQ